MTNILLLMLLKGPGSGAYRAADTPYSFLSITYSFSLLDLLLPYYLPRPIHCLPYLSLWG